MPKRSLNPSGNDAKKLDVKKIEQLNRAVEALLARADGRPPKEARLEPLIGVAADLCKLPREEFKVKLKTELSRGRKSMSTVAEPVASVHTSASPRLTLKDAAKAIEL